MTLSSRAATVWRRIQNPPPHQLTESLFLRLLGLVYLAAFASLWPQVLGLVGSHGIAPAGEALAALHAAFGAKAYFYVPTLFWLGVSDTALSAACVLGCFASLLLLAGLFSRPAAASCFVLYLSLVAAGQPFTGFQWDALLLECGFLALFSGAPWLLWAYRFLLFRLMFESGIVKLASRDPNWKNLHALRFHFLTQPLPTPLAYYCYRAPAWLLDAATAAVLVIELLVPFLLFFPRRLRYFAASALIALQLLIIITGNYAFFNLLTLSLCLWAFDDATYLPIKGLLQRSYPAVRAASRIAQQARLRAAKTDRNSLAPSLETIQRAKNLALGVLIAVGALQVVASAWSPLVKPLRSITSFIEPFEIVNSYGLFAIMTTTRPEIILEGSNDQVTWTEYSFRFKPGNPHRTLPLIAPYQPRLDWQMWFAALSNYRNNTWVGGLVYRLLRGDPEVTALLEPPPFQKPPHYMRAMLYDYNFSSPGERAQSGVVWHRRLLGVWLNPVSIQPAAKQ